MTVLPTIFGIYTNYCMLLSIVYIVKKKNEQDPFLALVAVAQNIISEHGEYFRIILYFFYFKNLN